MSKKIKSIFEMHTGFEATEHGGQSIMDCPFCGKTDHFFFNNSNFMWDCKVCHKNGNPIQFIRLIYDMFDNLTNTTRFISDLREIPISAVSLFRPKFNSLNNSYLIPTYKLGKVNNLYKAIQVTRIKDGKQKEGWDIICSSGLEHTLMNWDEFVQDEIWIFEGQWDRMAGQAILQGRNIDGTSVPGSGVWKPMWCETLSEKKVKFCYDNDLPGRTGFEAVILKHIATSQFKPKEITYVKWPEEKPVGYDVNDCYREYGRGAFNKLQEWTVPYEAPQDTIVVKTSIETVEADPTCTTFDEVMRRFEVSFHTTESMKLGLLLVLSSIYSVKVEGEQLWVRMIGPPSSGKTTIAKCVSGSTQVVLKSTFTGLFSGYRDEKNPDKDMSLIPLIGGKTLMVKDADALLRQKNVETIFSELRDFYDKDSNPHYRHGVTHNYHNIRSTMILCGTNVLRRSDQSYLGERFMDFELELSEQDRIRIEDRMLDRSIQIAMNPSLPPPETPVMSAIKGYLEAIWSKEVPIYLGVRERNLVRTYARLASLMRTKVDRERTRDRDVTFAPVVEVAARLMGQLIKTYTCATIITGRDKPNDLVHDLVRKITRDIIDTSSLRYRLCKVIAQGYCSSGEIIKAMGTGISPSRIRFEMEDLNELRMLDRIELPNPAGTGAKINAVKLKDGVADALTYIGAKDAGNT